MNNSTLRARKFKPTRFSSGISTDQPTFLLGQFGQPDPRSHTVFFDDFLYASSLLAGGDWAKTNNSGTGTAALATGYDGQIKLLTTAGATDDVTLVKTAGPFTFQPDQIGPPHLLAERTWFAVKFQLDDALLSSFVAGLIIDNNTNPLGAVAEGVYFVKAAGANTVNMVATKTSGGAATQTITSITTVTANTWIELAFCYDPYSVNVSGQPGVCLWFLNGMPQGSISPFTAFPINTISCTPIVQIKNSTAVARYAMIDYVLAAQERRF